MSATVPTSDIILPFNARASGEPLTIVGGGPFAVFLAYEILRRSIKTGKPREVVLLADRINAPSPAGSHVVLEMEGLFRDDVPHRKRINNLLRQGLQKFESMIEREQIQSRFSKGYEIKAETGPALKSLIDKLIDKRIYKSREIGINSDSQCFKLPGHAFSAKVDSIGQINVPELQDGLLKRIEDMGGKVRLRTKYLDHQKLSSGHYMVRTSEGAFITSHKPFLATGAKHQSLLPDFNAAAKIIYTMGLVMGPLSPEKAVEISNGPMAFCDNEIDGDVLWGGIDEQRFFTIGYGDLDSARGKAGLQQEIEGMVDSLYPGLRAQYPAKVCFGPIMVPENGLPFVGRMEDYDIGGGWGGSGIIAGYAAARAHARFHVQGKDDELMVFEGMHPERFGNVIKARMPANDSFKDRIIPS